MRNKLQDRLVELRGDEGSIFLMSTNMTDNEIEMSIDGEGLNMTDEEQDGFDRSDYKGKLEFISRRFGKTFRKVYYDQVSV